MQHFGGGVAECLIIDDVFTYYVNIQVVDLLLVFGSPVTGLEKDRDQTGP